MKNGWEKKSFPDDMSELVYGSRLLGAESSLVLHGGGNTSLKHEERDHTGRSIRVLRVKGSGSDLSRMDAGDFTALRLEDLELASSIDKMSDDGMVSFLSKCKLDPEESSPSVETFLHAFIPFKYVDHTHSDAILSITNTDLSEDKIKEILGNVIVVPYIHPGFALAKALLKVIPDISGYDGIVLAKHGLFTFSDSAEECYRKHIKIVTRAEKYLDTLGDGFTQKFEKKSDLNGFLPVIRGHVSGEKKKIILFDHSDTSLKIACAKETEEYCTYGPATSDMLIRTKQDFLYVDDPSKATGLIDRFVSNYRDECFHYVPECSLHDPYPSVMVIRGYGIITQAPTVRECRKILDLAHHSFYVDGKSSRVGNHEFISKKDAFLMEYWPPQEAKLRKFVPKKLDGTVALVTGAANGIGLEAFRTLARNGAMVMACDVDPSLNEVADRIHRETGQENVPFIADLMKPESISGMFRGIVQSAGGIDVVFNNAGILKSAFIEDVKFEDLDRHYFINSRAAFAVSQEAFRIMKKQGIGGNVVFNVTKNLLHPGPGMLSYGASKAFAAQVCHYVAKEGGKYGIRANVINPDKVFRGSKIWEGGVLEARAKAKGQTVEEYKTQNLLRVEVLPSHVVNILLSLIDDSIFGATTDTMIPVDGGVV